MFLIIEHFLFYWDVRKVKGSIISFISVIMIFAFIASPMSHGDNLDKEMGPAGPLLQNNSPTRSQAIRIDSDIDLRNLASTNGWNGSGSQSDPFIIENLTINDPSSNDCLYIGNTTDHLMIRNCSFTNLSTGLIGTFAGSSGINLYNSHNVNITNTNCSSNRIQGIKVQYCDNINITGNYCYDNQDGIFVYYSSKIRIEDNRIEDHSGKGIYILNLAKFTVINNNSIENNFIGIKSGSDYTIITNNTSIQDDYGIYLSGSSSSRIESNDISDCGMGISVYSGLFNSLISNVVVQCDTGIEIERTYRPRIILNQVYGGFVGITCYDSDPYIDSNTVCGSRSDGLRIRYCSDPSIIDNTFIDHY